MKSLIIYSSQSENTKSLATVIYDTISGEKELYPIENAPSSFDGYDLVAIGFWLQAGKPDPKAGVLLEKNKIKGDLFLFATHGAAKNSDHARHAMDYAKGLAKDAQIAGSFSCQGEVNPKVLEKLKQKETPPAWIGDADSAKGHPDGKDLEDLAAMVKRIWSA